DKMIECCIEMLQKRGGIALGAVLGARLAQDEHCDLGEVVTGEHVDAAGARHVGHRRSAVTVEAGAVSDADRTLPACRCHGVAPGVLLTHAVPSNPASPEGCCST